VVRKEKGTFALVAGHRRYLALKALGCKEAPVRIQKVDETDALQLTLIENIVREELTGVEEVNAVARLLPIFNGNQSALAKTLGRSQPYVSRCVRAAELVKNHATSHRWTKSVLFELVDSPNPSKALKELVQQDTPTVQGLRSARNRTPLGARPGGRYVDRAIEFRENSKVQSFSLRLNFDPIRTPADTRSEMIKTLESILDRLRKF
jgi:hypothetical protein